MLLLIFLEENIIYMLYIGYIPMFIILLQTYLSSESTNESEKGEARIATQNINCLKPGFLRFQRKRLKFKICAEARGFRPNEF